jgi:phosphopantothenate-cysteine ligase
VRILITAGGTTERIDQVRSITNHSTGRLGKAISDAFLKTGATIDYVTTKHALNPAANENITLHLIEDTADLLQTLEKLLTSVSYDAVIHSAAVSDYTTETVLTYDELLADVEQLDKTVALKPQFDQKLATPKTQAKKISSSPEKLVVVLKKTPKIIGLIKQWQPTTTLVGFKLLVGVSKAELVTVAKQKIIENKASFILANDLEEITAERHHGLLVASDGTIQEGFTKQEIANLIVHAITKE